MRFILIFIAILFAGYLFPSRAIPNQNGKFRNGEYQQDTVKILTVNDLINEKKFKGVIVLDNQVINYDNPFLYDTKAKNKVKEITLINKVPSDSIRKYGLEAKYGMLIMKTH